VGELWRVHEEVRSTVLRAFPGPKPMPRGSARSGNQSDHACKTVCGALRASFPAQAQSSHPAVVTLTPWCRQWRAGAWAAARKMSW